MKNTTRWCAALGLCSVLVAGSVAQGAEVTLYQSPDFGGAQLTLRSIAPNFASIGFNDRASSVVVVSGTWEFCSDAEFRGYCQTFGRGEYAALDRRLAGRISSAREAGPPPQSAAPGNYGQGAIQLFGRPNFEGRDLQLSADAAELASRGFNNRASSVIVLSGTWDLCSEIDFGGTCRRYTAGRYPDLGYEMTKEVSSARLVRAVAEAPVVISPGYGGGKTVDGTHGRAILYTEPGLRGDALAVSAPVSDLARSNFSGVAESMYVESGTWLLCSREFFRGKCGVFGPGRHDDLIAQGFRRSIASIRPGDPETPPSPVPSRSSQVAASTGVELFADPDFMGTHFNTQRDTPNLDPLGFNDRAASLIVHGGTWELCTDAGYAGRCAVFTPGRYARIGGLARQLSSLRKIE